LVVPGLMSYSRALSGLVPFFLNSTVSRYDRFRCNVFVVHDDCQLEVYFLRGVAIG